MKEPVKFVHVDNDQKKRILELLGYEVTEKGFLKKDKKDYFCPITKSKVHLETASILPGSILVINTNPLSISEYLSEYLEN